MKDKNLFKSFRVEIVLCSIMSLLCSIVTEVVLFFLVIYGKNMVKGAIVGSRNKTKDLAVSMKEQFVNKMQYDSDMESANGAFSLPFLKPMKNEMFIIFIVAVLAIGVILFIAYFLWFTRGISKYLSEICTGINVISSGDFNARIAIKNEDEFALIASSINKMASDVSVIMQNERTSEKMKHDLITNVAHDLRTPLTSIIGYLDLAAKEKEQDGELMQKYLAIAYEKSKRLEQLLEDLFHFTKVSSGEIKAVKTEIDVVKLMEQLMEEFYPSFQLASLISEFTTNEDRIFVMADGNLLARAFANLLSNAVKYGSDGKNIRVHILKQKQTVSISVVNYGELIPTEDINNIFDKFYRVEGSRSRDTGGTGLGLAIAKTIISMHNGTIMAKSDYDGTVFEIILNLAVETKLEG